MRKRTKKRITLEKLASMIAQGFDETASKFEATASKKDLESLASKKDLGILRTDVEGIKTDVAGLKQELITIKNQMVTKSYLDDKLADLEGSVITRQRKEDHKVNLLIEFLRKKKVLGKQEVKMLQEFQVFPALSRKT